MAEKTQEKSRRAQGGQLGKSNRGFAGMDANRQREIASEGGRAAHQQGRAHEFTSAEAREAGRKGGMASGGSRRRAAADKAAARTGAEPTPQSDTTEPTTSEGRDLTSDALAPEHPEEEGHHS